MAEKSLKKKVLIGCSGFLGICIILIVGVIIWLASGPEGGVKLANDMDKYAVEYIEEHNILDVDEKLVAYYDVTIRMKGTEAAILTDKRVIYHIHGQNSYIKIEDIIDITHRTETLIGDIIEIYSTTGESMKIEIAPLNQGQTFLSALMRLWESQKTQSDSTETALLLGVFWIFNSVKRKN